MTKKHEKAATVVLRMKADSGYSSEETHRISADQWSRIVAIANEPDATAIAGDTP